MPIIKNSNDGYDALKIGDFEILFSPSEGNPRYDCVEISIHQGGYYGASASSNMYDEELDAFLENCARFREYRDKNKKTSKPEN